MLRFVQAGQAGPAPSLPRQRNLRPAMLGAVRQEQPRMTPLDKPIRRELARGDELYTLTTSPGGLKLVPKGKRKGLELAWTDLASGDAALASALQASLQR